MKRSRRRTHNDVPTGTNLHHNPRVGWCSERALEVSVWDGRSIRGPSSRSNSISIRRIQNGTKRFTMLSNSIKMRSTRISRISTKNSSGSGSPKSGPAALSARVVSHTSFPSYQRKNASNSSNGVLRRWISSRMNSSSESLS